MFTIDVKHYFLSNCDDRTVISLVGWGPGAACCISYSPSLADIDECLSDPCQNGETCNNHINAFNCSCAPGYQGDTCEEGMLTDHASNSCAKYYRAFVTLYCSNRRMSTLHYRIKESM